MIYQGDECMCTVCGKYPMLDITLQVCDKCWYMSYQDRVVTDYADDNYGPELEPVDYETDEAEESV